MVSPRVQTGKNFQVSYRQRRGERLSRRARALCAPLARGHGTEATPAHQLELVLRGALRDGAWRPGQFLPTERELQGRFGVSRITVRQALENLVRDGLVNRRRGRGTEVNPPRPKSSSRC